MWTTHARNQSCLLAMSVKGPYYHIQNNHICICLLILMKNSSPCGLTWVGMLIYLYTFRPVLLLKCYKISTLYDIIIWKAIAADLCFKDIAKCSVQVRHAKSISLHISGQLWIHRCHLSFHSILTNQVTLFLRNLC